MRAEEGWSRGGVEVSLAIKVLAEYEPSGRGTAPGGRQVGVSLEYGQSEGVW